MPERGALFLGRREAVDGVRSQWVPEDAKQSCSLLLSLAVEYRMVTVEERSVVGQSGEEKEERVMSWTNSQQTDRNAASALAT